jgi:chromosome segregation ATPase
MKLESEIDRLNLLLEECDFKIRVFKKENDQLKDDLFNIDSNLAMARKDLSKAQDDKNVLEIKIIKLNSKSEEDENTISSLENQVQNLNNTV